MIRLNRKIPLLPLVAPSLIASLVWFTYEQGVTGDLFYDDLSFLGALANIDSFPEASQFVADGAGGPLGRRIALVSFLPHADRWPATSIDARRVNVLIHLINGGLLCALGYMILRLRQEVDARKVYWVAFAAASLWLVMPMLASTTLITVQRWTSLAAMFGLLGLVAFVYGYFLQSGRPYKALLIQGLGLGIFSLLAILTKESGALFPIYALVIDAVLLRQLPARKQVRWVRLGVLWLGLVALLVYLSPFYRDWLAINTFRGWSSLERLQTQIVLLWQYLYLGFFPQPTAFGPFHDDVELVHGWLAPTLALSGFAFLALLAFAARKRTPWPLFALMWFFTAHLIESTVIQLELMFEHRNYLALYGFSLALAVTAWQLPKGYARLGPALFTVYGLMLCAILYGVTSTWGNSLEAAENWVKRHPASPRAVLHLSEAYFVELGNPSYSLPVLDRAAEGCPRCTDVRMQAMLYACGQADEADIRERFEGILASAQNGRASIALLDGLYPLQELLDRRACSPLTAADAIKLPLTLRENPNYAYWSYQVHTLFHAAYFAKEAGDLTAAGAYLAEAEELGPHIMPILEMQVRLLTEERHFGEALAAIDRRRGLSSRPRFMSDATLNELAAAVHQRAKEG